MDGLIVDISENSKNTSKDISCNWYNDIVKTILEDVESDIEEQIIALVKSKYPHAGDFFYDREGVGIAKRYSEKEYILLDEQWGTIDINMLQTPGKWEEAMLDVLCFCIEKWYSKVTWKIQPQKKPSARRSKILLDKWISFGFTSKDGYKLELELSQENIRVLKNKIVYYLENGKWFTS